MSCRSSRTGKTHVAVFCFFFETNVMDGAKRSSLPFLLSLSLSVIVMYFPPQNIYQSPPRSVQTCDLLDSWAICHQLIYEWEHIRYSV